MVIEHCGIGLMDILDGHQGRHLLYLNRRLSIRGSSLRLNPKQAGEEIEEKNEEQGLGEKQVIREEELTQKLGKKLYSEMI